MQNYTEHIVFDMLADLVFEGLPWKVCLKFQAYRQNGLPDFFFSFLLNAVNRNRKEVKQYQLFKIDNGCQMRW